MEKLMTIPLPSKGKVHLHIGPLKNLVRWTHSHHRVFGRLTPMVQGRAKKARVNPSENDVFLESDDQDDAPSALSQTLSRFKKSPKRKGDIMVLTPHTWPHSYSLSCSASYETLG